MTRVITLLSGSVILPKAAEDSGPDTVLMGAAPKHPDRIKAVNTMLIMGIKRLNIISSKFKQHV